MAAFCRIALMNLFVVTAPATLAHAQPVPATTLASPTATFAQPFAFVQAVREQSDGRVLVLDGQDIRILRIDFRSGSVTPLGRTGRGPGEFTLPLSFVALPGDTTLALDIDGGGRALVITHEGASPTALRSAGIARGAPLFQKEAQADARGRLYEMVEKLQTIGARQMRTDSSAVRRLDRGTGKQDTLATFSAQVRSPLIDIKTKRKAAANAPPPPFASVDQWAVAPDGRVAIVTVNPYRVTYVSENDSRTEGAAIAYKPLRVNAAQKEYWREFKSRPVPTLVMGPGGSMTGVRSKDEYVEPTEWPDVLSPFLPNALRFAPDGMLWIERTTEAGAPQTFDLVNRAGRVASRVVLPPRSRLVGFGERTVYVVRVDGDDFEHLERYNWP